MKKLINQMINNKTLIFYLLLFVVYSSDSICQRIIKVNGTAQVRVESNMTKEEAREKAKDLAMVNAIENAFGTYVGQESDVLFEDGKVSYNVIGTTRVMGEWVKTLNLEFDEQKREIKGQYGNEIEVWIICNIKGEAKKVTSKAAIYYQTLNCPKVNCRTVDFYSGEPLYVHFKSPVNGFLSVFLSDGTTVYRLLPYDGMVEENHKSVKIIADKDYLFFSKVNQYFENEKVDELELYTYMKHEYNTIHFVFSEKDYTKPMLNTGYVLTDYKNDYKLPKSISIEGFNNWLADNIGIMDSFQIRRVKIKISKSQ